jgi:Mg2+/Co2+ transporter CorB
LLSSFTLVCLVILIAILVFFSGFFSSSETCMMAINRYRLRHLVRKGSASARRVEKLLERPDRLLGVILIGNTFTNILASSLATFIAVHLFGDPGIVVATILLTLVVLIFAEIAPKTVAAMYPQQLALAYSWPLLFFLRLIYPLVWLANSVVNTMLRVFNIVINKRQQHDLLDSDELRVVVDEAATEISAQSKEMLLGILDLGKITVDDVMLPRNEIVGIDLNASREAVLQGLMHSHYACLPIYQGGIDAIVGIVNMSDILPLLHNDSLTKKTLMREAHTPYFILEGTKLTTQLHKFKSQGRHIAFVVDEYGDIQGMVTLEDILEEIVGELDSNMSAIQSAVVVQADGGRLIDGSANVRELNKLMNWDLPMEGAKTLSGLIIDHLEGVPSGAVGFRLKGLVIEVVEIKGRKIEKAKVFLSGPRVQQQAKR